MSRTGSRSWPPRPTQKKISPAGPRDCWAFAFLMRFAISTHVDNTQRQRHHLGMHNATSFDPPPADGDGCSECLEAGTHDVDGDLFCAECVTDALKRRDMRREEAVRGDDYYAIDDDDDRTVVSAPWWLQEAV